ncbi:hypothetical protein ACFLYU_02305 [Candidatus Dependentiae bacterium]
MKHKKIIVITAILTTSIHTRIGCDQIITFFLKPYPIVNQKAVALKRAKKIGKLGKMPKYSLRALNKYFTSGIFSTYEGYLAISDLNGQVIFPRKLAMKDKDPKLHIIVTRHIAPILMLENTVHHWEVSNRAFAKIYSIERKKDAATRTYFWDVKEAEIPEDNILSRDTIVIIAKPKYVYIPTGITITTKNPQLILPDIFVKRGIEKLKSSLYVFGLKNFLAVTDSVYKKGKKRYSQQLKE